MEYLGIDSLELIRLEGLHIAREITQQPELWRKVWDEVNREQSDIQSFLNNALTDSKKIILTGAGTSAFIGFSLRGVFQRSTGIETEVIATTDIVSHPKDYLLPNIPTLMVSFARSGNSPESVAAVDIADEICKTCYHLIITCNAEGKLASHNYKSNHYIFTLPKEANDQSLAMTSSYSGMLLAGLLIGKIKELKTTRSSVDAIVSCANKILGTRLKDLRGIAKIDFKRAVFLGAGPFYGTATEAHLKLQELTGGKVICKKDTYLGFRHGPKAVVDETTLIVYFLSSNEYVFQYEKDLIDSMKTGTRPIAEIGISESYLPDIAFTHSFEFSETGKIIDEEFLPVCYILPAQILSFYKSLELGLRPDSPSVNGAITRVVEGVQIYSLD